MDEDIIHTHATVLNVCYPVMLIAERCFQLPAQLKPHSPLFRTWRGIFNRLGTCFNEATLRAPPSLTQDQMLGISTCLRIVHVVEIGNSWHDEAAHLRWRNTFQLAESLFSDHFVLSLMGLATTVPPQSGMPS